MVKTIAWVLAISLIFGLGTAIAQKQDSTQSQQQQPLVMCPCITMKEGKQLSPEEMKKMQEQMFRQGQNCSMRQRMLTQQQPSSPGKQN